MAFIVADSLSASSLDALDRIATVSPGHDGSPDHAANPAPAIAPPASPAGPAPDHLPADSPAPPPLSPDGWRVQSLADFWRHDLNPIHPSAKMILMVIEGLCRTNPFTWVSNGTLTDQTGLKARALQEYLVELERLGWIVCVYDGPKKQARLGIILARRVAPGLPAGDTPERRAIIEAAVRARWRPNQDQGNDHWFRALDLPLPGKGPARSAGPGPAPTHSSAHGVRTPPRTPVRTPVRQNNDPSSRKKHETKKNAGEAPKQIAGERDDQRPGMDPGPPGPMAASLARVMVDVDQARSMADEPACQRIDEGERRIGLGGGRIALPNPGFEEERPQRVASPPVAPQGLQAIPRQTKETVPGFTRLGMREREALLRLSRTDPERQARVIELLGRGDKLSMGAARRLLEPVPGDWSGSRAGGTNPTPGLSFADLVHRLAESGDRRLCATFAGRLANQLGSTTDQRMFSQFHRLAEEIVRGELDPEMVIEAARAAFADGVENHGAYFWRTIRNNRQRKTG